MPVSIANKEDQPLGKDQRLEQLFDGQEPVMGKASMQGRTPPSSGRPTRLPVDTGT